MRKRPDTVHAQPGDAVVGCVRLQRHARYMTEHDGFEHVLRNGDILIVDSTIKDERVEQAFAAVREQLREKGRQAYEQLRAPV